MSTPEPEAICQRAPAKGEHVIRQVLQVGHVASHMLPGALVGHHEEEVVARQSQHQRKEPQRNQEN